MARPDLIIFDYDGVVADSEMLNNAVIADVLTAAGVPTTQDQALARYMGKRWRDFKDDVRQQLGGREPDFIHAEWTRQCRCRAETELAAVLGVTDFVDALDLPRCIASSSNPQWIEWGLERFGLAGRLGPIFSAAIHVERGKPFPDLFLNAAAAMQADPARTTVIEDSPTGVQAGVAAGMRVIGLVAGGHVRDGHAERLTAAGAHHIARSYDEVVGLIA